MKFDASADTYPAHYLAQRQRARPRHHNFLLPISPYGAFLALFGGGRVGAGGKSRANVFQ